MSEKIYTIIPESKNIIVTLLKSINNNSIFRKHVSKLSESTNENDKKKAETINNTIQNIKVFNTKINPLFLAQDIGILMGISQINYLIRKFEPEEKVIGHIKKNNKTKKVIFLTRYGIYRCFFASRSPLAKVFRKFICNLIDHMVENEPEIMNKISYKFQKENEQLIEKGMIDLHNKLADIENKYLEERKKTELLEIQYDNEKKKRIEIENDNIECEISNSYNMMYIEQLKKEKKEYIRQIKNIQDNIINDNDSIDVIELKLLKEKFMKPLYIYILHPDYFKRISKIKLKEIKQRSKKNNLSTLNFDLDNDSNSDTELDNENKKITMLKKIIDDTEYKNNFDNIFSKDNIYIDTDEILYYTLGFGRNIAKSDKIILVNTLWVINKVHFINIIKSLCFNCDTIEISNIQLYKTTLDEIHDITREEFISLLKD